jgi:hypothetical protein
MNIQTSLQPSWNRSSALYAITSKIGSTTGATKNAVSSAAADLADTAYFMGLAL